MSDDYQIEIPPSFLALHLDRRQRLSVPLAALRQRSEFCEDLAQQLVDRARAHHFDLGLAEDLVLARCHAGLCDPDSGLAPAEAWWIAQRLAELLGWSPPEIAAPDHT